MGCIVTDITIHTKGLATPNVSGCVSVSVTIGIHCDTRKFLFPSITMYFNGDADARCGYPFKGTATVCDKK